MLNSVRQTTPASSLEPPGRVARLRHRPRQLAGSTIQHEFCKAIDPRWLAVDAVIEDEALPTSIDPPDGRSHDHRRPRSVTPASRESGRPRTSPRASDALVRTVIRALTASALGFISSREERLQAWESHLGSHRCGAAVIFHRHSLPEAFRYPAGRTGAPIMPPYRHHSIGDVSEPYNRAGAYRQFGD